MRQEPSLRMLVRRRLTRRAFLGTVATAVGAAGFGASLAGCGGETDRREQAAPGGSPIASAPKRGGTLTLPIARQMSDLNPQAGSDAGIFANRFVYDHLFYDDYVNGKVGLSLAQSMENPDPLTYIFKIKPAAKFQNKPPVNGRPVTSEDVVASWDAFVANPRTYNKTVFKDQVDRCETPDASTLVVKVKKPDAWFLSATSLGGPLITVVAPKELLQGDQMDKTAVGPGAYVLEKFDPASEIRFLRRPDGWHTPERPYIDRIVYQVITDTPATAAAFKAKQIDGVAARDKLQAEEFRSYGAEVVIDRDFGTPPQLWMRADAPDGLFKDPRTREAVYCALDIKELIDGVDLGDGELSGPVPPYLKAYSLPTDELKRAFPHDVRRAKELLAAAGWDANLVVDLKYPAGENHALLCQLLQNQLAAVGIKTKLMPQDYNTIWLVQTFQRKDFQLTAMASFNRPKTANAAIVSHTTKAGGTGSVTRWGDAEVDDLVAKEQVEFDAEKRRQIIVDAQRLLLKRFGPQVLLYNPYTYTARWSYYHPIGNDDSGDVGVYGHYSWTERT